MSQIADLPQEGYIRLNRLIPGIIPCSRTTIWRKVRAGEFPKPVKLSERITAWRASDIRQWMDDQASEKGGDK